MDPKVTEIRPVGFWGKALGVALWPFLFVQALGRWWLINWTTPLTRIVMILKEIGRLNLKCQGAPHFDGVSRAVSRRAWWDFRFRLPFIGWKKRVYLRVLAGKGEPGYIGWSADDLKETAYSQLPIPPRAVALMKVGNGGVTFFGLKRNGQQAPVEVVDPKEVKRMRMRIVSR